MLHILCRLDKKRLKQRHLIRSQTMLCTHTDRQCLPPCSPLYHSLSLVDYTPGTESIQECFVCARSRTAAICCMLLCAGYAQVKRVKFMCNKALWQAGRQAGSVERRGRWQRALIDSRGCCGAAPLQLRTVEWLQRGWRKAEAECEREGEKERWLDSE